MVSVYFFIPNLIGYARIILEIVSFFYVLHAPLVFIACYSTSQLLDAFDGWAARRFDQCSKFGAFLDMLTDRTSTAGLLAALVHLWTDYAFVWILLLTLDYWSHWGQMQATLVTARTTHKSSSNPLVALYYKSRTFLFLVCASQEVFLLSCYALRFDGGAVVGAQSGGAWRSFFFAAAAVSAPLFAFKQVTNVAQLKTACDDLVAVDESERAKRK